jgi:hypothetical protein
MSNAIFPPASPLAFTDDYIINFHPQNREGAMAIQQALFAKGIYWASGEKAPSKLETCAARGLHVDRGRIYSGTDERKPHVYVSFAQLADMQRILAVAHRPKKPVKMPASLRKAWPDAPEMIDQAPKPPKSPKTLTREERLEARVKKLEEELKALRAAVADLTARAAPPAVVAAPGIIKKTRPPA